jgi:hypothetical protein
MEDLAGALSRSADKPKNAFAGKMAPLKDAVTSGKFGSGKKGARSFRSSVMPDLLKGYGQHLPGNGIDIDEVGRLGPKFQQPLSDILVQERLESFASATLDKVINKGLTRPDKVYKALSQNGSPIGQSLRMLNQSSGQGIAMAQFMNALQGQLRGQLKKNFSLASPLASGFVPFDLMPFVRTIYPVYTPLRNKIPRVPGQGTYHRGKILSSITGSLPGQLGALQDDSTSEFFGGSFASWPNSLPASGTQNAYDLIIPYKFFALTEGVSWLQQFAGQGFDDLYGLASLVLLQEFMLLEEHDILASSSQALAQPTAPTAPARSAGTGETGLSGVTTNVYIVVTALDYWGETAYNVSNVTTTPTTNGQVIDVTINPVNGAIGYAIYLATGGSNPGRTSFWRYTDTIPGGFTGSHKVTLQGALPTSGANPPAADTGTSSANRQESLISVLSDRAYNGGSGPYPGSGSSPAVNAGYKNLSVGQVFGISVLQTALQQMFNGQNGYLANPSEIITSANDALALANSITSESVAAYQLRVQQSEVAGVLAGVAVSNVVNPITRSMPEILVHPYLPQGNALLMSYTLPQTQNNLGNVVENVMVQDYAQIGWPVIDPTFRQSILRYGLLWFAAPQYCGLLGGLQQSATTPYS